MSKQHSNSYWRERAEREQDELAKRDTAYSQEVQKLHEFYFNEIEKEIQAFEHRYMTKQGIDLAEVRKRVSDLDVKAFEEKAKRYVAEKDFSAKANSELSLYNLKMRVNRLEMLQRQLDLNLLSLADGEYKMTEKFLNNEYVKNLEAQAGILGLSVAQQAGMNSKVSTVVNTPFKGVTWSDNLWERQNELRGIVGRLTAKMILKGENPTKSIPLIKREFDVSTYQAKRLAVTEGARIATSVQRSSFEQMGYEEYEFIAEPKACDICKPLDGKIFKVKDMLPGDNAAPMHPFCRCSTAAHYSENEGLKEDILLNTEKHNFSDHLQAEKYAMDNGVQYADFSKMKPEWFNAILEQLDRLPDEAKPVVITDSRSLQTLSGRKINRKANSYYGVTQYMSGVLKSINGEYVQFRDGSWVGFNTTSFKTLKSIADAKEKVEKTYLSKTKSRWSVLKSANDVIAHEFGHVLDNYKNVSDKYEWKNIAKKWYAESGYDHLKVPSEAWADAVGLKWNGKKVPSYVDSYLRKYADEYFKNPNLFEIQSEMTRLYRNKDYNKRRPVNMAKQKKLTKEFREQGGYIWQDDEAEKYLASRKASAMNLNANTIVLQKKATISEILEELFHAEQWRRGTLVDNEISRIKAEIEAQKYLLSVEKRYNIPINETKQTKENLKYWEKELKKYED